MPSYITENLDKSPLVPDQTYASYILNSKFMSASRNGVDTNYMRYSLPVTLQTTHILLEKLKLSTA